MAYHLLATALETLDKRPSNASAFASAVGHALGAFVPFDRFHAAGRRAAERRPLSEARLVDSIETAMARDLNPIVRCFLGASSIEGVLAIHRGIHQLSRMTVKTELAHEGGAVVVKRRTSAAGLADVVACKDSHLAAIDIIVGRLPGANSTQGMAAGRADIRASDVADQLGLAFTAAGEVAAAFEADPALGVADVARRLGCQPRTLQRELKAFGITASVIRQATMLGEAAILLRSTLSLTQIAHQAGYADQAHMTRAFVSSCGMPPSLLRKAFA